jgi:hypothetical protein
VSDSPFRAPGKTSSPTLSELASQARESRQALLREAASLPPAARQRRLELAVEVDGIEATGWLVLAILVGCAGINGCVVGAKVDSAGIMLLSMAIPTLFVAIWAKASENRKREREARVAEALAWADKLPFPAAGYADWLASEVPLIDVVVAAPLDRQFADAVHAVDPAIEVALLDERTARLAIPPRVISRGEAEHRVGDRQALARLCDRLLVPLHSEVGLVRVDLGGSMLRR